jgi:endogenous inhibitor of DNA gyrase (YacG/DUF329 family)
MDEKITIRCDWCGKHFEREDEKERGSDFYYCSPECAEKNSDAGFKMHT